MSEALSKLDTEFNKLEEIDINFQDLPLSETVQAKFLETLAEGQETNLSFLIVMLNL